MSAHPASAALTPDRGAILRDVPTFDDVVARVIRRRGAPAIARASGLPLRMLTHYATFATNDPHGEHRPLRGREIVPLSIAAGTTAIVEHLCEELGGYFVRRPEVVSTAAGMVIGISAMTREVGDVLHASTALLDGATEAEVTAAEQQLAELACAVEALRLRVRILDHLMLDHGLAHHDALRLMKGHAR